MAAFQEINGRLKDALSKLSSQWHSVSEVWNDDQQQRFNANYMQEYEPELISVINHLEHMGEIFDLVQRED